MIIAIIFIVAVVLVLAGIKRGADYLFDHVDKPRRTEHAPDADESEET